MEKNAWMNDDRLAGISDEKLDLLVKIVEQSRTKSTKELIPFFLRESTAAHSNGINFSNNETDVILDVLKERMSPEEIKRIETVKKLSSMITKKQNKH